MYNSDLVHSDKEVKIMRVTVEIPETYTKSAKEHIFNMLKNHGAIDIDGLNLSDVRNHFSNVKAACAEIRDFICVENEKRDLKSLEGYDLIPKLEYSEAVNLLTLLGKFIDIDYMFELDKSLKESIRLIYENDFRTIRSILGSYLEKVQLWHVGEKLNTKINDEVKEFLDVGASVVGDLRDCGYPSKSTRCADPWISNKSISLKAFKILSTFIITKLVKHHISRLEP